MNGPDPLQADHYIGWMRMNNIELTQTELNLLIDIDVNFLISVAKEKERNRPKQDDIQPYRGPRRR